jgi:hypothetical protein
MSEEAKESTAPPSDTLSMIDSEMKQKKRYARNRLLALIGLGILVFLGLGFLVVLPYRSSVPAPVSETVISDLTIRYFFPATLEVGTPATFSVSMSSSEIQSETAEANQRLLKATPIANGTPNVPLSQTFGPDYMVFAFAQLDVSPASKFDLPQLRQDSQSLEQTQPVFSWTITPMETTQAVITVTITGQWKPIKGGNEIDIPLGKEKQSYDVSTPEPFILQALTTVGNSLFAILPIFGGIGLTIPWIVDQIQKKRSKSRQSQKRRTRRGKKLG